MIRHGVFLSRFTVEPCISASGLSASCFSVRKVDAKLQTAVISTPIRPVSPVSRFDSRSLYACVLLIKPEIFFHHICSTFILHTLYMHLPFTYFTLFSQGIISMKMVFCKRWWHTGVTFIAGNMPLRKSQSLGLQLHCWSRAHWLKRWILHSLQFSPYLSTFSLSWKLWWIDAKSQTQFTTISMCETMRYFYYM